MEYKCDICNKYYSSRQSRWNHIKKYHVNKVRENILTSKELGQDLVRNEHKFGCRYCNKAYSHKQTRHTHEKICKIEYNKKDKNTQDEKDKKIEHLEKQLDEIKDLLQKSLKIHPKTLQKINNQLNNTNNGTINNTYNIVQLGHENLEDILTQKDKLKILNRRGHSLKELVDLVHISDKYKQFKSVYITNLQNTIGYKFDSKSNQFVAVNKSELLDEIIDCRMCDIQTFYNELEDSFDVETKKIIQRFIDRMNDEDDKLKGIKKEEIKLLLYNSREKIKNTADIEL